MTSREDPQSQGILLKNKIYDPLHGFVTGKGKHFGQLIPQNKSN